jgi:hypothetical protein
MPQRLSIGFKSGERARQFKRGIFFPANHAMECSDVIQITHPFAEAEKKTLLFFVNVKQEKYD